MKTISNFLKWLLRVAVTIGVAAGLSAAVFIGYQYFTNELAWDDGPRIEAGKLYLQVRHEDGRVFTSYSRYSNVSLSTISRVSKRTREYTNVYAVPNRLIRYLAEDGIKLNGVVVPRNVLDMDETLFACIFIAGDSVGCKKVARSP